MNGLQFKSKKTAPRWYSDFAEYALCRLPDFNCNPFSYVKDGVLFIKPTLTNDTFTAPGFMNSGTIDLWGADPADQCTSNSVC